MYVLFSGGCPHILVVLRSFKQVFYDRSTIEGSEEFMKKTILALFVSACCAAVGVNAQSKPAAQKIDAEYTAKIKESLQDPRITTELVDHLPASDTVPSPMKFLGRYVGQPGELTYAKDIHRYYEQLAKVSPRPLLDDRQDRGRPRHCRAGDRR